MSVEFYDQNAETFIEQTVNLPMHALYQRFCSRIPPGGSILDAGCGAGRDSLAFAEMGFEVVAFDASIEMVKAARRVSGVPVYHATFQDVEFDRTFDGIWACASLLHVPRETLKDVLLRLTSLLSVDGIFYASFKYGSKERVKDGRYFNDIDENLLKGILLQVGSLRLSDAWITDDRRPERSGQSWLNFLLSK